jgi:Tfp pilus assembly protein PilO
VKSKKQLMLAGAAAVVVVVFAWYQVIWTGQNTSIAKAEAAKAASATSAKGLATKADALEAAKTDTGRARLLQKLDAAVPAEPGLPAYLRWVNGLADETHVGLPSVTHTSPEPDTGVVLATGAAAAPIPPSGLNRVSLSFQATGAYDDLLEFLHRLDSAERLIVLDSVSITPNQGVASQVDPTADPTVTTVAPEPTLSATITAHMYSVNGLDTASSTGATP